MDLNLDTLKHDILRYLDDNGFVIFYGEPGMSSELPTIEWDSAAYPDYEMFMSAARKTGAALVIFASEEFDADEIEAYVEAVKGWEESDERRDIERQLKDARRHAGSTCTIELGFDYQGRIYHYIIQPDWYREYQDLTDDIDAVEAFGSAESDDDDSMGGYYSQN